MIGGCLEPSSDPERPVRSGNAFRDGRDRNGADPLGSGSAGGKAIAAGDLDGVGNKEALLSIESLAQRVSTVIVAPLLGFAVTRLTEQGAAGVFWPIGLIGLVPALLFLVIAPRRGDPG